MQSLGLLAVVRSWRRQWLYPVLFVLASVLSFATFLTLDSVQRSVQTYVDDNQRALVGGDWVVSSPQPLPMELQTLNQSGITTSRQAEFSAMASAADRTLLTSVKAVEDTYPLYGNVELRSGALLSERLQPSTVVVEAQVLAGLDLAVGDLLRVGEAQLTITDVLLSEPDRPLGGFGSGGRVLMHMQNLDDTKLLGQRSRVNYRLLVAADTPDGSNPDGLNLEQKFADLSASYPDLSIENAQNTDTRLAVFANNVLLFLKLLVLGVLILTGIALYGLLTAFVQSQQKTNAIRRALGESTRRLQINYLIVFLTTALASVGVAALLAYGLLALAAPWLASVFPTDLSINLNALSFFKVLFLAGVLTGLITLHSLRVLKQAKPVLVLKQGAQVPMPRPSVLWMLSVGIAGFALLAYELASIRLGLQVGLGLLAVGVFFWAFGRLGVRLLAGMGRRMAGWRGRLAANNLVRKGNQSSLFFVTLALSVTVLSLVGILNHALNTQFVESYPKDAPNVFLLDVQSDQHSALQALIPAPITYYPVVRARIHSVNDTAVADIVRSQTGDDPTRVFNLSYAESIMQTEYLTHSVEPSVLYAPVTIDGAVPVSVLDSAADLFDVGLGDVMRFDVQGIEVVGQITSIRSRYERGPTPFFYFLFEPKVLQNAPQIQFATANVPVDSIPALQASLAQQFPAITSIDGTAVAAQIQAVVTDLSRLVQLFTLLALLTGVVVLLTSLLATSQDRLKEAAWFRLLGMQKKDLYWLNVIELMVLGISAAVVAVSIASIGAWWMLTRWFDLPFAWPVAAFVVGGLFLACTLGLIAVLYVRLVIGRNIMARVRALI